jgi:hypothetical protein
MCVNEWQQQEAKLKAELAVAVKQRERELGEAHEQELTRQRQNNEKMVQLGITLRTRCLEKDKGRIEKRLSELQEQLAKAELASESAFLEGRTLGKAETKKAERALVDAGKETALLPGVDGFAILSWIKEFRPALLPRVLVITGDSGGATLDQQLLDLGVPAIRKPFTPDDLIDQCLITLAAC